MSSLTARRRLGLFINTAIPWAMPLVEFVYIRLLRKIFVAGYQALWKLVPVRSPVFGPPKGFVTATIDWLAADPTRGQVLEDSYPDGDRPAIGAPPEPECPRELGRRLVVELNEARVCTQNGAILGRDDRLLAELTPRDHWFPSTEHDILVRLRLPPIVTVDGRILCLYTHPALASNYGHWLFECVAKFFYFRDAYGWDYFDRIVVNRLAHPFQEESLRLAGIPREKTVELDPRLHIEAKSLVVSSYIAYATNRTPRWVCHALQRGIAPGPGRKAADRKIYLTRRGANRRRLVNEEELLPVLARYGIEEVAPERLSLSAQAALFSESRLVIGLFGAALCNIAFCPPGSRLLELRVSIIQNYRFYEDLARNSDVRYDPIEATPVNHRLGRNPYYADVSVPVAAVEKALRSLAL